MAKKIRFPLVLAEGAQVRSMEELREHFDLEAVLGYYKTGKLLTWLEDRYLEGEAKAIRALDETAPDFQLRMCETLGVKYTGADVDLEAIHIRQERLARLRIVTDEDEFLQNIDSVAFDQEELADLLDEERTAIYLCGERFTVPASRKGVTYVGINEPEVKISGELPENFDDLGITFRACKVDRPEPPKPELPKQTNRVEVPQGAKIVATSAIRIDIDSISGWQDIVSVACYVSCVAGIKREGDLVVSGNFPWWLGNVQDEWNNMISIAFGVSHTVGLHRDGTVLAKSDMGKEAEWCKVDDWTEIIAVACGEHHTVGLRRDRTVVAVGRNYAGQCNVQDWEDIVSIGCTCDTTYGVKRDGTVVGAGFRTWARNWTDIVSIDCSLIQIAGLKRDGTVVTEGRTKLLTSSFQDIISVACGNGFIVGLRRDRTVVIASDEFNDFLQEAENWKNVVSIAAFACTLAGIVGPEDGSSVKPMVEAVPEEETSQQDKLKTEYEICFKCICCGSCVNVCPMEAISGGDHKYSINVAMCVKCGACADVCPVDAILVWKL